MKDKNNEHLEPMMRRDDTVAYKCKNCGFVEVTRKNSSLHRMMLCYRCYRTPEGGYKKEDRRVMYGYVD